MSDLYSDLGLAPDAMPEEIAAAHRAAAKRTHPDLGGDREEFERVQHAALVLRDPERRARYDATGDDGTEPDNTVARRNELVIMAFDKALAEAGADARLKDIIAFARQALRTDIAEARKFNTNHRNEADRLQGVMDRLTRGDMRDSPLHSVYRERVRKLEAAIASNDLQIGHAEAAIEMVGEYAWRRDEPPPAPQAPDPAMNGWAQILQAQQANSFFKSF